MRMWVRRDEADQEARGDRRSKKGEGFVSRRWEGVCGGGEGGASRRCGEKGEAGAGDWPRVYWVRPWSSPSSPHESHSSPSCLSTLEAVSLRW